MLSADTPRPPRPQAPVLVSILNWNGARKTLHCLASIKDEQATTGSVADVSVLVLDNGSRSDDRAELQAAIPAFVTLQCLPVNLGFTGGHNIAIASAIAEGYDFIWLLNNDAEVVPGTLLKLVNEIMLDDKTGAVSPVLRNSDDRTSIVRCVNTHNWVDWESNRIVVFDEAQRLQENEPGSVWLDGTAILGPVGPQVIVGPVTVTLASNGRGRAAEITLDQAVDGAVAVHRSMR